MVLRLLVETYPDWFLSRPDSILEPFWLQNGRRFRGESVFGSVLGPILHSDGQLEPDQIDFWMISEAFWQPSETMFGPKIHHQAYMRKTYAYMRKTHAYMRKTYAYMRKTSYDKLRMTKTMLKIQRILMRTGALESA